MAQTSYLDLDLLIEVSGEHHRARVLDSPVGQAVEDLTLPFPEKDLDALFAHVQTVITAPQTAASRPAALGPVTAFGAKLFGAVFDGQVGACLVRSLDEADRTEQGLRIRLRSDDPALSLLPWEFLYDQTRGSFLCLSDRSPLVRYVELPDRIEPIGADPPLSMLGVIASPTGLPLLDVEHEWAKLEQALAEPVRLGRVVLDRLATPTVEALQDRFQKGSVHILHFVGHGGFSDKLDEGLVLLQDAAGGPAPVSADQLGVLLHDHDPLRMVVLNACDGARQAGQDPFAGVAQRLVRSGIPAVIGMQFQISDPAAIAFAGEFYGAIADGLPVDASLTEARKAVYTRVSPIEWATPVLFMRAPDGRVFDLADRLEPPAGTHRRGEPAPRRPWPVIAAIAAVVVLLAGVVLWSPWSGGPAVPSSTPRPTAPRVDPAAGTWAKPVSLPVDGDGAGWAQKVLAAGPAGQVAVGSRPGQADDASVWTSPNGAAWTSASAATADTFRRLGKQTIFGVAYGPSVGYVAVGYESSGAPGVGLDGAVWRSTDGSTWTRVDSAALGGPNDQELHRVVWANDRFVAGGYSGDRAAIWTSTDGTAWQLLADQPPAPPSGYTTWIRGVGFEQGLLVAVGASDHRSTNGPAGWSSGDGGTTWEPLEGLHARGSTLAAVAGGDPGLVAVGYDTTGTGRLRAAVWFSGNGRTWTRANASQGAFTGAPRQEMLDVTWVGGRFLAVGHDGSRAAVWTSKDGLTWTESTDIPAFDGSPNAIIQGVTAIGPERVLAVGQIGSAGHWRPVAWTAQLPASGSSP